MVYYADRVKHYFVPVGDYFGLNKLQKSMLLVTDSVIKPTNLFSTYRGRKGTDEKRKKLFRKKKRRVIRIQSHQKIDFSSIIIDNSKFYRRR